MNVYERIWTHMKVLVAWKHWGLQTGIASWIISSTQMDGFTNCQHFGQWGRIRGSSPITKTSLEVTMKNLGTLQSWSIFPYMSNIWSISIHFRCWASDFSCWCSLDHLDFLDRDPGVGFAVDQLLHGCSNVRSDSRLPSWDLWDLWA